MEGRAADVSIQRSVTARSMSTDGADRNDTLKEKTRDDDGNERTEKKRSKLIKPWTVVEQNERMGAKWIKSRSATAWPQAA